MRQKKGRNGEEQGVEYIIGKNTIVSLRLERVCYYDIFFIQFPRDSLFDL